MFFFIWWLVTFPGSWTSGAQKVYNTLFAFSSPAPAYQHVQAAEIRELCNDLLCSQLSSSQQYYM
jgi:hypothetical protein